ncbi:MAG: PorV/PorQ family protein, partial [bacterium]
MRTPIVVLIAWAAASLARASGGGSSGAELLRVAMGARPAALGENFTGLADDVTAAAWNPAGLARLKGIELSAMHLNYLGDASHEFLAAGMPLGAWGGVALSGTYASVKPFDYTAAGSGLPPGSSSDLLAAVSWGASAGPMVPEEPWYRDLYVGVTAKFIRRTLGGDTDALGNAKIFAATAGGLDLGALYQWRKDLTAGLAVQNLGTGITFLGDERDPLPLAARLGVAWAVLDGPWVSAMVLGDVVKPVASGGGTYEQGTWGGAGLEVRIADVLSLRGGARQGPDGFRAVGGAGIALAGISLDIAYVP